MSAPDPEGLDLSAGEVAQLFRRARNGSLSDADVQQLWESVPFEQKRQFTQAAIDAYVLPHFDDVRARARDDDDAGTVREHYAALDEDDKQEKFDVAVEDVVGTAFQVREHPREGLAQLKALLRDPYTVEALLLIFDNPEHIDPWYAAQMKAFAAERLRWVGMALAPELYDPDEVRETYRALGFDVEALEATAEAAGD